MTPELKTLIQHFDSLCETIAHVLRVNESSARTKKARPNRPVNYHTPKKREAA
jgi:hypothetical protein